MQAIHTKRTERGYSVTCNGARIQFPRDYSLNGDKNHLQAALALCAKMKWTGVLNSGSLGDNIWVHVFTDTDHMYAIQEARRD